ncbi:MAG: alginate O-acetyltransferase AlgX-related protein [Akkermansiaceae bacterium]
MSDALPTPPVSPAAVMGKSEKMAVEEIALTVIKPTHAWCVIAVFLLMIMGIGIADLRLFFNIPPASTPASETTANAWTVSPAIRSVLDQNRLALDWIKRTEDHVSKESPFSQALQPWVQSTLLMAGEGVGEVMVGREGWLYYRPSFRFLTKPDVVKSPDSGYDASAKAILAFAQDLRERGIPLVIVPAWPKMAIHPEHFGAGRDATSTTIHPLAYERWKQTLEAGGVVVFDSAKALSEAKADHRDGTYLKTDSHWNPVGMKRVASGVASYLLDQQLVAKGMVAAQETSTNARNAGDLLRMLRLPEQVSKTWEETTQISVVRKSDGSKWLPDRHAPVLVLGDSFCNIFSMAGMGWGEDAGFTEHLGAALMQPVDAILRNGDGAHATRSMLARDLNAGQNRLEGKKVVVWEFAASQITEGIWPVISCKATPPVETKTDEFLEVADDETIEIIATIATIGTVPNPNTSVYKDYVTHVVLDSLEMPGGSPAPAKRALAYGLVMQDKKNTALASLRQGQRIKVKLRSWLSAEAEFGRHERAEFDDDLSLEPVNWWESFTPVE